MNSILAKSILNKTKRRDPWFLDEYTINPYSGCSFNCQYCYIRGSKYGINMEEKTAIKSNALQLLEKQLANRAKKNQYGIIVLSSATDPYLHFERKEQLTRRILEMILHFRFPVHILTKGELVLRDLDILKQIAQQAILPADLQDKLSHKAFISFSFSTIDDGIAAIFEPGAPSPAARFKTLTAVAAAGFHCGVSMMPLLPYITDTGKHLEEMFSAFKTAGAKYLFPASITLFGNGNADSRTLVFKAVEKHYPHLLQKYHSFFDQNNQMPDFYISAFNKKMAELSIKYGLKNSLLNSP